MTFLVMSIKSLKTNLKVIYDAAHAFSTEIDGVGIWNFGDISMFSFRATKTLTLSRVWLWFIKA